jgi:hypothetical protein
MRLYGYFISFLLIVGGLFSSRQTLQAQTSITGLTENSEGQPVAGASITIRQKDAVQPYSFTISNAAGKFTIPIPAVSTGFLFEASHVSFQKKTILLSECTSPLRLILERKQSFVLPQVTVKVPPIQRNGDTLKYRVSAFTTSGDRVIGDVIDKIPGLQRNDQGQILYQGRAINKYYVEGLDLMGSQYGLANESIRYELVDQVEIWERHQSMRVLDSTGIRNEVALNLKLSARAKKVWNGHFTLGAGLPLVSGEGALNLMKFAPSFQTLASLKMNNTGEALLQQLNELAANTEDWEQNQLSPAQNTILSVPVPDFNFLTEKRRLLNKTVMPAVNILKGIRTGLQWRINVQGLLDETANEYGSTQQIFLPSDTILINEFQNARRNQVGMIAAIQVEKNAQDRYFRIRSKNEIRQVTQNSILTGSFPSAQQLRYPYLLSENTIESVRGLNRKKMLLQFRADIRFFDAGSQLSVEPGIFKEILNNNLPMNFVRQEAPVQSWRNNMKWVLRKVKDKWNRQLFFKTEITHDWFQSALFKDSVQSELQLGAPFINRFQLTSFSAQAGLSVTRQWNRLLLQSEMPAGGQWLQRNDLVTNKRSNRYIPLFLPSLTLTYKWNQFVFSLRGKANISPVNWQQNYNNYIATDYRTVSAGSDSFLIQRSWHSGFNFTYTDPLKGWSGFLTVTLSNTKRNLLPSVVYNGIFADKVYLPEKNRQQFIFINTGAGKYINPLKGAIQLNGQYSRMSNPSVQNGQRLTYANEFFSGRLKVYSRAISMMHLETQTRVSVTRSGSNLAGKLAPAITWQQQLQASPILIKNKLMLVLKGEWGAARQQKGVFPFSFYDAAISYRHKKAEWKLECLNLLDTRTFTMPYTTENQQYESYIRLRPLTILLKAVFIL